MSEKQILIAEDDISIAIMLTDFLSGRGFSVEAVKNGREALDSYKNRPAQIVITDIEMPVMNGNELINNLKNFDVPPVIFVTTSHKDPEMIIDIMKKGIYDYIVKPFDLGDILLKITRAFEAYEMKRAYEITQREKVIRLENTLEWYRFEEKIQTRDLKSMGDNIFQSLLTSFNQGSGFGGLVTLMSLMKSTSVREGDYYKIRNDLFEMIMGNVESAEKALEIFGDIAKLSSGFSKTEKISVHTLHENVASEISELQSLILLKKHKVILSDNKKIFLDYKLEINAKHFRKVLREIILNALKFSQPGSDIVILFLVEKGQLFISVINDINASDKVHKGIPLGYENLVFEPFFRLTKNVYDEYKTLDYGLGLTLVQRIISNYGGKAAIGNITDHSDIKGGPKSRVECSVMLKVAYGESGDK